MSLREYQLAVEGLNAGRQRHMDDLIFLAHQTASLVGFAYHQPKKMPKLETLLHTDKSTQRRQSPEEQIAIFKGILASKRKD